MVNEANYKENHTNNDDVNAPTDNILEDEPEDVKPINNNNNEPMSSIDELTINDAEIVPEIGSDNIGGRQGL